MARLTVATDQSTRELPFSPGATVREILEGAGLPLRTGCLGNGACGLCLVRIEAGEVSRPTRNESLALSADQFAQQIRLGCQVIPLSDVRLRLINTVAPCDWRDLPSGGLLTSPENRAAGEQAVETGYGMAVDLGTTHISLSLWQLGHRRRVFGRIGLNPQAVYGADVVSRLIAASNSPEVPLRLANLPIAAIAKTLQDMWAQHAISPREVNRVVIVGNTPMLALLTETDPRILLQPRFWTERIDCRPGKLGEWVSELGIHPEASIELIPPFAGFVGSDALAGVLATGLTGQPASVLIDFGTNSEIALWDGGTLWLTSAAGGPAFEGSGIQCGMPAETGAIFRVDREPGAAGLHCQVIGGVPARGLCGSGLVDLIACLRSSGELKPTGRFATPQPGGALALAPADSQLRLTSGDVDMFQRAKAAIGAGLQTLLALAGIKAAELRRVCVCGAFGRHLHIRHAQLVGLLPDIAPERIELCGNTALAGAEQLLLFPGRHMGLESLRNAARLVNLSQAADFETLFMDNLFLQPFKVE